MKAITHLIEQCLNVVREEMEEYDKVDVERCLYSRHSAEIEQYTALLGKSAIRTQISSLMRRARTPKELVRQLEMAGLGNVQLPLDITFRGADSRVHSISAKKGRAKHYYGAAELREAQGRFNIRVAAGFRRVGDFLVARGGDLPLAEALEMETVE